MKAFLVACCALVVSIVSLTISVMVWRKPLLNTLPTPSESSTTVPTHSTTVSALEASISGITERLTALELIPTPIPTTKPTPKTTSTPSTYTPFGEVIYLGSGSSDSRDWKTSGVEITLNSSDYPIGTKMKFEAGLSIIGGEAWARLKNKTTGGIISLSEVSHNTSTTTWKGSPAFSLEAGNNVYEVELRSTSGEVATMQGSRLILTK